MTRPDYVLKFLPNMHRAIWGEESWGVSVHRDGPGIIANGPLAGRPLAEVCPDFSLLSKVICARDRLSVQVHPNERTSHLTGGEPKTEMWCMLDDGPIYAGLKPGTRADDVYAAVAKGRLEYLLVKFDARKGEVYFIPGGLVHAIGDNVHIYELQQNSNTTYRLYDWNRVGADGRPRELHLGKSLVTIDYTIKPPAPTSSVDCPFFSFRQVDIAGHAEFGPDDSYMVLFAAEGDILANGETLACGESALVPPHVALRLEADRARVFVSWQTS